MELRILEAAQGQPMDRNGVRAQTVMSSTHQYPDGTVTAMRRRAAEKGWPVYEWCYRETLKPHGWLTADQVERKRRELSRTMWAVEYELQEPSAEGRAIHPTAVERMFDADRSAHTSPRAISNTAGAASRDPPPSEPGRIRPGRGTAPASTGPRSATTPSPLSCAAIPRRSRSIAGYRAQRRSWQVMTEHVGALLDEYPGLGRARRDRRRERDWGVPGAHTPRPARGGHAGRACSDRPVPELHWGHRTGRDRLSSDRRVLYRAPVLRGKTICSGAGIPPIRSSPWRWPITPSRRAGGPATTASPSDGGAGAPAELARRTGALGRRSWLPHTSPSRRRPHIPLACRAHQSECGRTPSARGCHHEEGPSP